MTATGAQNQNLEVCNNSISDANGLRILIKPTKRKLNCKRKYVALDGDR